MNLESNKIGEFGALKIPGRSLEGRFQVPVVRA